MSTSNSGKLVPVTPSRSPIPQLVKLIAHLVREGKLDDVQNILMSIEKKMRLGIGKWDPEDIYLEEKFRKSEKECMDLKVRNAKLIEEKKWLIDRVNESEKIVLELKSKRSENDQILNVYQEKIKFFDLRVTQMNMELFKLWEKRSEAEKVNEEMRSKLSEAHQNEERLRHKLIDSGQTMKEVSRENFETKMAMERMKRKLPEPDHSTVEELKRQNFEERQTVEKLSRQHVEANLAIEKLRNEKLEADKVLEEHKRWFENFAPIIKNVGEDLGKFLNEKVCDQANYIGNSKEHSGATGGSGGDELRL